MNENKPIIAERIRNLRKEKGYTQEQLAEALGLNNKSSIANYESGYSIPSDDIKLKMCEIFDCTMDYLMGLVYESKLNTNNKVELILELANGLSIQETNYVIKQLNKAKIQIGKESENKCK